MADEEVSWKSPTLNKGQHMALEQGDYVLTVSHADRTIDPYLAGVWRGFTLVYTGLHSSLADARRHCTIHARSSE